MARDTLPFISICHWDFPVHMVRGLIYLMNRQGGRGAFKVFRACDFLIFESLSFIWQIENASLSIVFIGKVKDHLIIYPIYCQSFYLVQEGKSQFEQVDELLPVFAFEPHVETAFRVEDEFWGFGVNDDSIDFDDWYFAFESIVSVKVVNVLCGQDHDSSGFVS